MTKTDVEAALANQLAVSKESARDLLNIVLDEVTLALSRRQRVSLVGFGSFEVRHHAARIGRNPQTGKPLNIAESNGVHFKPGKALKDALTVDE